MDPLEQPSHAAILHELQLMRQDVKEHREETRLWREAHAQEIKEIKTELTTNTTITTHVANLYTTGKTITAIIRWLGYVGAGIAGIAAAWWAITRNDPGQPPNIFPPL